MSWSSACSPGDSASVSIPDRDLPLAGVVALNDLANDFSAVLMLREAGPNPSRAVPPAVRCARG